MSKSPGPSASRVASRTLVLPVDPLAITAPHSQTSLHRAAQILREGGTVAFPTETVYGLGANALDPDAVGKIFNAKRRPTWDPLIVHVSSLEMLERVAARTGALERSLIEAFWPGPLTLLLARADSVPPVVTAGRQKVGARMPAHPVARALIAMANLPIAAPSANSFGRTSPTTARHVLEDLDGRVDAILDGGPTTLGLESTVIDASAEPPTLYRHGMVSIEQLRGLIPGLVAYQEPPAGQLAQPRSLPSPGVGLRHYAPRARLVLIEEGADDGASVEQALNYAIAEATDRQIGVLLPDEFQTLLPVHVAVWRWGRWTHPDELAHKLFAGLRALDREGVDLILCPLPAAEGIGAALRDRLQKAAKPAV